MPDKVSAIDMYLQWSVPIDSYVNTPEEQILLNYLLFWRIYI